MGMKDFHIIAACDLLGGIGKNGTLPWRLKGDMKFFKETTTGDGKNTVIMGRKTWESIPDKFRPLPNRRNIILTRNPEYEVPDGVVKVVNLDEALEKCSEGRAFVIGGGEIYRMAIHHPSCRGLYLTAIDKDFGCDTTFPNLGYEYQRLRDLYREVEGDLTYRITEWVHV